MYKIILEIYFIVLLIYILVIAFNVFIHKKSIGLIIMCYLEEIICKIFITVSKIFKNLTLLVILISILKVFDLKKYVLIIENSIISYKEVSKIVLGAFLASGLGILTQVYIRRANYRKEIIKYSKILYNDISNLLDKALEYKVLSRNYEHANILLETVIEKASYDPKWREYYSYLTEELDKSYYDKISKIYDNVEKINEAIDKKDVDLFVKFVKKIYSADDSKKMLGFPLLTNKDLLEALKRLSVNKKIKTSTIRNLFNELVYQSRKKEIYSDIEKYIISLLKKRNNKPITSNEVETQVKEWLVTNNETKNIIYENIIERITFDVLNESESINLTWGECSLKKPS